ncbi:hypothetical protein BAE44_0017634 [Dichanthelium oligosanthes]|uniref:MSP domain-containing protein n=1 Tax=Dichanthelium oligosanthes TaxID=888268 RepID=A0A1E5V8A3_9POAL|nr:hypothetical protein BAE44_0017634 [Dichanthelium oligosanthes]
MEPNKWLPCSLQLTNNTDDYVAFIFILPQGKVLYYPAATGRAIMPPRSTLGIVIDMLVKEEALADLQCKDTCHVRSVIVDKDSWEENVNKDMFDGRMDVHEVEVDIVFAPPPEQPQAPSSVHRRPMFDGEQDWEDGELESTREVAALEMAISLNALFYK